MSWFRESRRHSLASRGIPSTHNDLPTYLTDKPIYRRPKKGVNNPEVHRLGSKDDQKAPLARHDMIKLYENYPYIPRKIKRVKPDAIIYSSKPANDDDTNNDFAWTNFDTYKNKTKKKIYLRRPPTINKDSDPSLYTEIAPMDSDSEYKKEKKILSVNAINLDHELKHIDDFNKKGLNLFRGNRGRYEEREPEVDALKRTERMIEVEKEKLNDASLSTSHYKDKGRINLMDIK